MFDGSFQRIKRKLQPPRCRVDHIRIAHRRLVRPWRAYELSDNSEFLCEQKDLEKKAYVLSRPGVNAQGGVFHVCAKKTPANRRLTWTSSSVRTRRVDSGAPSCLSRWFMTAKVSPAVAQPRLSNDGAPVAARSEHDRMANAIRALAMDAVEQAKSGHPGLPMGAADIATVLFTRFLRFDPADPAWPDRDRFVLSAG